MNRDYTHYINVRMSKPSEGITHCFDDVPTAGRWLEDVGEAATVNAARTGVYCALEGRIKHYRHYIVTADCLYTKH